MIVRSAPQEGSDIENLSRLMDACFVIPIVNWRFGLNTLLDLVPGLGDAATSLIAFNIVLTAVRRGLPRVTFVRMALNVAIYAIIGVLPVIGDAVDTWFKPNMRNMALLRRHMHDDPEVARRADVWFVAIVLSLVAALLVGSVVASLWILHYVLGLLGIM